jgi:type I restriction-modification system DNA methylase subunit
MFHGFDFDSTMLRIGSMNMLLHGVENPNIRYRDSLAQEHGAEEESDSLVLANPPFAGSLDFESCAKDLQEIVKTNETELLFLALFLRLLLPGDRAVHQDQLGRHRARVVLRHAGGRQVARRQTHRTVAAGETRADAEEHAKNNLPDILRRLSLRESSVL